MHTFDNRNKLHDKGLGTVSFLLAPFMTRTELLVFMRAHPYAVEATATTEASVQAALVGIAVTDSLEIVFDSVDTSRKVKNVSANPRVAFVIGGWAPGDERTVQYEGVVDRPTGIELERLKEIYYVTFPDGPSRLGWPGLVYLRARPSWIRYSNFNKNPAEIVELDSDQIAALR